MSEKQRKGRSQGQNLESENMEHRQQNQDKDFNQVIEDLKGMRRFAGPPNEFWPAFLEGLARLAGARLGLLLVHGNPDGSWQSFSTWPAGHGNAVRDSGLGPRLLELATTAQKEGYAWERIGTGDEAGDQTALGLRLELENEERASVAVLLFNDSSDRNTEETVTSLQLVADIPAAYQLARRADLAMSDISLFAEALDLMVLLNEQKRYLSAAMTSCNELASRYRCERVSLGWLEGGYIRLQAISHMEKFEKKMDTVQSLEAAMEESFDQNEEIVWPNPVKGSAVVRDHEAYSREAGTRFLVSLPIRLDDDPVGVVTGEREDQPFTEAEVRGFRVYCDQAARRLDDLKRSDRWFGAKLAESARGALSGLLGVEHTFPKLIGIILCAALAFLLFGKLSYRVEAPFILRTDDLAYVPAPFDGYIDKVPVEMGDIVKKGETLLTLDTRELLLEESTAIANQNRYFREAEKARAQNALADMKIALALKAQAEAKLNLVRYHLKHARLEAPFAGIVVEGDLDKQLGAPVRKGDVLLKVALLEKLYAEVEVDERDIHEVKAGAPGEIAFVSRPNLTYATRVERIEPVAVAKEKGNVFLLRCILTDEIPHWWRPGMSGVAKINAGKRTVLWILTHRTVDFLRILLWW